MRDATDRRAERTRWPVKRYQAGHEPGDDLSAITTPAERVAMMWTLAVSAWKLAGRPLPSYERRSIPAVLYRPGAAQIRVVKSQAGSHVEVPSECDGPDSCSMKHD